MGFSAAMAVMAVATVVSSQQSQQAAKAQKQATAAQMEAQAAQQRGASVAAQRERIKTVREARIARANVLAGGMGMGFGSDTSGIVGATSSIQSQMGSNIGYINQQETFAAQASEANRQAAGFTSQAIGHQAKAQQWQAIGSLASSAFGAQGGWARVFGGNTFSQATPAPIVDRSVSWKP